MNWDSPIIEKECRDIEEKKKIFRISILLNQQKV